ncbi:MAG TPA: hypothetical protein VFM56_12880, partial [Solimonas sp.]|nr:hypothetical protein [Solimonas sp.]
PMTINLNKKSGKITADDGTELLFQGRKLHISADEKSAAVTFQILGDGTSLVIYNDLQRQGFSTNDATRLMGRVKKILEEMGFTLDVV